MCWGLGPAVYVSNEISSTRVFCGNAREGVEDMHGDMFETYGRVVAVRVASQDVVSALGVGKLLTVDVVCPCATSIVAATVGNDVATFPNRLTADSNGIPLVLCDARKLTPVRRHTG